MLEGRSVGTVSKSSPVTIIRLPVLWPSPNSSHLQLDGHPENTNTHWESLIRKWNSFLDNEMGRKEKLLDYVNTQWFWVGRVSSYSLGGSIVSIGLVKEGYKTRDYDDVAQLKLVKQVKPLQNSTWPYRDEISPHYFHELETEGYDVIGVNIFPCKKCCWWALYH